MMSYITIKTLHQIPSTTYNENFVIHTFFFIILHEFRCNLQLKQFLMNTHFRQEKEKKKRKEKKKIIRVGMAMGGGGWSKDAVFVPTRMVLFCPILTPSRLTAKNFSPYPRPLEPRETLPHLVKLYFLLTYPTTSTMFLMKLISLIKIYLKL